MFEWLKNLFYKHPKYRTIEVQEPRLLYTFFYEKGTADLQGDVIPIKAGSVDVYGVDYPQYLQGSFEAMETEALLSLSRMTEAMTLTLTRAGQTLTAPVVPLSVECSQYATHVKYRSTGNVDILPDAMIAVNAPEG